MKSLMRYVAISSVATGVLATGVLTTGGLATAVLATAVLSTAAHATPPTSVPSQIDAQGVLRDATGAPIDLPDASLVFRLYDAATGGAMLWSEARTVPVVAGVFDTLLPSTPPAEFPTNVQARLMTGAPLWLSIQMAGQSELPRTALVSVPYAFTANRALTATALECSGCIDASEINASTFTAQNLTYAPLAGDLVTATTVAGAISQLDSGLADHIANPNGHHPADSSGIAIKPTSVSVGATKLTDGALDFGPGVNDALSKAQVETLTGGGNADALHTHTAASITGLGGGACVTLYGSGVPTCPEGYSQAQAGYGVTSFAYFPASTGLGGSGGVVCADVPVTGSLGPYALWMAGGGSGGNGFSGTMRCSVCCPAPSTAIAGCYQQNITGGTPSEPSTYIDTRATTAYTLTGAANRSYHLDRVQMWVVGGYTPGLANWDIKVTRTSDGAVLARIPAFMQRQATTASAIWIYGGTFYPYLVRGDLDLTLTGNVALSFEVVDATTGASVYVASTSTNASGMISGIYLSGCVKPL